MRKLLARLIWLPLALIFSVLLVANRQLVSLSFDPTSVESPALQTPPLFLWIWLVGFLLLGFFLGSAAMWASGKDRRAQAAADRKAVKELKRENQILAARTTGDAPMIVAE